jgi:hypothetical protein
MRGLQAGKNERGTAGAVYVEFLIAFLPVLTMFLCLVQLALLYAVRLVVEHAAVTAARTAAVVIGDDAKEYTGSVEPAGQVDPRMQADSARFKTIRRAALLVLSPYILNGTIWNVDVTFPPPNQPDGPGQDSPNYPPMGFGTVSLIRVHLKVDAICRIGFAALIMCKRDAFFGFSNPLQPHSRSMNAEAVFPYQGASYTYP